MRETNLTMKLIMLVLVLSFSFLSHAEDYTFQGGSLVIPMDKLNQNSSQSTEGNGIFQAYGLIMELLQQGVTVFWVIDATKTSNDQPDFTLKDGTLLQVVRGDLLKPAGSPTLAYAGGPFVIDANIPEDITKTLQIRDGLLPGQAGVAFDSVVIHQVNESFSAPVGQLLSSKPPKIALLDTGDDNLDTLKCYLAVAGVPSAYYEAITPADLGAALNIDDYYVLWIPHWDNPTTAEINQIKAFMDKGGDILAMCNSIDAFEATNPIMVNSTMSRNGATHNGLYADYRHFDITPSQIGDFLNFTPDAPDPLNEAAELAAHTFSFRHSEDSLNWQGATNVIAWDNYDATLGGPFTVGGAEQEPQDFIEYGKAWAYFTYRKKDANPEKGDIFYLGGHSYASCFGGGAGTLYRLNFQMSRCRSNGNRDAFWENSNESMSMTIEYTVDGVPGSITFGPLFEDTFYYDQDKAVYDADAAYAIDDYLEIYTTYGTGGIRTNFGPGCQGGGQPAGTDQLAGLFIEKVTNDVVAITKVKVSWDCGNCSGNNYHLDRLTVKLQGEQQCGTPYLGAGGGGHLYSDPGNGCDSDDEVEIVPNGFSVAGSGSGSGAGQIEDIAGIRYILNTLLPGLGSGPEFGRSTPIATDDGIYFGTFSFPGNLGHFRKWVDNTAGDSLLPAWDAAEKMPAEEDRNLYTFVDKVKVPLQTSQASVLLPYTSPDLVVADVEAYLSSFRSQALGGIEKSSAAVVTSNARVDPDGNRPEVAYINTTYGLLELIEASGTNQGVELGGYMPQSLLSRLKFTGRFNALRPILNSSPTARDVYLPINNNPETREWFTYLTLSLHPDPGFEVLDITDPNNVAFKWKVTDSSFGNASRIAIAQYRKEIAPNSFVLGYAAVAATSHPDSLLTEGVQVKAFDLETGDELWPTEKFSQAYTGIVQNVSDTPPFVTLWDTDQNGFDDRIIITDLMGRIWEIDMETGKKPLEESLPTSIYNFSSDGKVRPIGAAPAIGTFDTRTVIGVGTGGVDWSPSDTDVSISNKVSVLDLTTRNADDQLDVLLEIDIGRRKLYSPVVFAGGYMYFIAVSGDLNSPDPRDNLVDAPDVGDSELYLVNLTSAITGQPANYEPSRKKVSKGQSSIYIKNGQAHISGLDGKITRLGKKKEKQQGMALLDFMLWRFGSAPD